MVGIHFCQQERLFRAKPIDANACAGKLDAPAQLVDQPGASGISARSPDKSRTSSTCPCSPESPSTIASASVAVRITQSPDKAKVTVSPSWVAEHLGASSSTCNVMRADATPCR
ncbi:hypothetical protein V6L77_03565 [Pannonibacter sp. Pt2-lr]